MKTLKSYTNLLISIYFPILLIAATLLLVWPKGAWWLTSITYIFLIICVLFIITPIGNIRLGTLPLAQQNAKQQFNYYLLGLLKLIGLQIAIAIIFIGLNYIIIEQLPLPPDRGGVTLQQAVQQVDTALLIHWGLFPWPLYAAIAVVIAIFQTKSANPTQTMATLATLKPLFRDQIRGVLGMGSEIFFRQALIFTTGTLAIFALGLAQTILQLFQISLSYGITVPTLVFCVAIFLLFASGGVQKIMKNFWQRGLPLERLLLIQGLTFLLLVIILMPLIQLLLNSSSAPTTPISPMLQPQQWLQSWLIFCWTWLIALTPIVAQLMVKIIRGWSVRASILGSLILPLGFAGYWRNLLGWLQTIDPIWLTQLWHAITLVSILLIAGFCYYTTMFTRELQTSLYYKDASKNRSRLPFSLTRDTIQAFMILALLYLFTGLMVIQILYFATGFMCVVIFVLMVCSLWRKVSVSV